MRRAVCSVFGLDRNFSSRLVSNPVVSSTLDCNYGRRLEGATAYAPFVNAVHKRLSSQSTKASAPPPDVPATTPDRSPDATREATDIKSTPTSPPRRKPHVDHPHPYPPPYRRLPVHLKSRTGGLVSFAPTTTHVPIDTSFPDLINPDGTRVVNRSTHRFRPPYLPDRIAKTINIRSDDLYILSRSIELFGSPGVSDWVSELRERICPTVVAGWVNYMLSRLPWNHIQVRALKDAAWAEHLEAMQSPSLKGGSDDWEAHPENEVSAPTWPSDPDAGPNLGLSWSTSGERDQPRYALPPPVIHGPRNFPRPKRIARAQPWDTHLVVVFATSTARRAVLAAYSAWVRKQLVEAHKTNQIPKGKPVLPPVSRADLGEIKVGQREKEAMHWAERVGWRPEYRMRAYPGERARGKAGTGDGWYESTRLRQQRLTQEALRREKSE